MSQATAKVRVTVFVLAIESTFVVISTNQDIASVMTDEEVLKAKSADLGSHDLLHLVPNVWVHCASHRMLS